MSHIIDWIKDIYYFYWYMLFISLFLFGADSVISTSQYRGIYFTFDLLPLGLFVGFCAWVVYCAIAKGYGLG